MSDIINKAYVGDSKDLPHEARNHYFLATVFIVVVKHNGSNNTFSDGLVFNNKEYKITNSDMDYIKVLFDKNIREKFKDSVRNVAVNVINFSYMGYMTDDEYES